MGSTWGKGEVQKNQNGEIKSANIGEKKEKKRAGGGEEEESDRFAKKTFQRRTDKGERARILFEELGRRSRRRGRKVSC